MSIAKEKAADAILVIDVTAKKYAGAHAALASHVAKLEAEIAAAKARHLDTIRLAAGRCSQLQADLEALIASRPHLFEKPRSMTLHGIRLGIQKGKGRVEYDDEEKLVARIRDVFSDDKAEALLRTVSSPIIEALMQLPGDELKKLGVRIVSAGDQPFVKAADTETDKLVKMLLALPVKAKKEGA